MIQNSSSFLPDLFCFWLSLDLFCCKKCFPSTFLRKLEIHQTLLISVNEIYKTAGFFRTVLILNSLLILVFLCNAYQRLSTAVYIIFF